MPPGLSTPSIAPNTPMTTPSLTSPRRKLINCWISTTGSAPQWFSSISPTQLMMQNSRLTWGLSVSKWGSMVSRWNDQRGSWSSATRMRSCKVSRTRILLSVVTLPHRLSLPSTTRTSRRKKPQWLSNGAQESTTPHSSDNTERSTDCRIWQLKKISSTVI